MIDIIIFSDSSIQDTNSSFYFPTKSAGPHRIKTEVRNSGYSCEVIDLFFYFSEEEIQKLCEKLISNKTLVVGFSTTFWYGLGENLDKKKKFATAYRYAKNLPNVKIVFAGPLASNFSEKIYADKSFNGFSDFEFIKYLDTLSKSTVDRNPFDFNRSRILYSPNDCLDYGESTVIEITRGCIFKCNFCAYPLNGKKKFDYIKDKEVLKDELLQNYFNYGITNYTFSDDTFNDSMYKMDYLHNVFTSLPFKISFVSYLRLDLLNAHQEQIKLLKEMGLVGAFFGIETLNKSAGSLIGKGMDPEKVKQLLFDLKKHHWQDDVNVTIGLISGLPFETYESHNKTIEWITDKELCLVDKINIAPLNIPNPLLDKYEYKSQFQLDALKYGFYWPDPKSNSWKNYNSFVKSYDTAIAMSKEIYDASLSVKKHTRGNFALMLTSNIARYGNSPKTLQEMLKMDIDSYNLWLEENKLNMISEYVSNYKSKKLSVYELNESPLI